MPSAFSWPVLVPYAPSVLRRRLPWALGLTTHTMHSLQTRVLAPLFAAFTLAGCGGIPIDEVKTALAATRPCCSSYETISYTPLINNTRTKVQLTTASLALQTSEGLAYFAAFTLPTGVRRLEVQALNTEYLPKSTYPDPLLVLLDSQRRRITEIKDLPLVKGRHVIIPGLVEHHYGAEVTLPAGTQYVLVFARPNSDRTQSAISDNGTHWAVPSAPAGTLAIVPR